LLTNDGDFAFQMTHPKFQKRKLYEVALDQPLQPLHQQILSDFGVDLPDGKSKLILTSADPARRRWQVELTEGRNRQIRRSFGALGYTVTQLHRTTFGPYQIQDLKSGAYTEFTPQ
jgi:23S rRNA pseudouridine2605 synthase